MRAKPVRQGPSQRLFKATAGHNKVHPRNQARPMRGGIRL